MTLCNKGLILKKYSMIVENDLSLIYDAYLCFKKSLQDKTITKEAKNTNLNELNKIQKNYNLKLLKKKL